MALPPPAPLLLTQVTDADFRLMVDGLSEYALFLLDSEGRVLTWNAGAQRFKGYRPEEIIGKHFREFYPQDLRDRRWPEYELERARELGRFEDEGWRVRKDGSLFWANIVITRLLNVDGTLRGFSKITRDLSDRREQEHRLRISEERFRLLVEGVQDYAIFQLDVDGNVASWNTGAQRTKGYAPSEIIGRHFSVFYPPEVAATGWPMEALRLTLEGGRFEDEGWRVRKDGGKFWASVVITPLFDDHGTHRGFAKVTRDLTDKRRIDLLEDEGRRTTSFLAMLGHELRNPLAPIANALEIMGHAKPGSPPAQAARAVIGRQLRQLTRLVDDLLDASRLSTGKIQMAMQPVRLAEVVLEAVESVHCLAQAEGQELTIAGCDTDLVAQADRARMLQVVGNLLTNAIKFTPQGGAIRVQLQRDGPLAQISVKDSGVGVAEHMLSEIFRPFVQGEQDAARSQGGLGLGLSLVQQVVDLHGGEVSVFSATAGPARGTEFIVSLPVVEELPQPEARPTTQAIHDLRRLLIVDDNKDAADSLLMVLEAIGYRCEVVYDGTAAIEAARVRPPDAVLLDLGLPGMDGLQVGERLHRDSTTSPRPRVIALTGYGSPEDRAATARAGFDAHLTKPVALPELAALLKRLLA